jgi:hypothetical protein
LIFINALRLLGVFNWNSSSSGQLMIAGMVTDASNAGRMKMLQARDNVVSFADERTACDWAKLIRKLRWIGLEDEARQLEQAVSTLPPEQRGCVSADPSSTD